MTDFIAQDALSKYYPILDNNYLTYNISIGSNDKVSAGFKVLAIKETNSTVFTNTSNGHVKITIVLYDTTIAINNHKSDAVDILNSELNLYIGSKLNSNIINTVPITLSRLSNLITYFKNYQVLSSYRIDIKPIVTVYALPGYYILIDTKHEVCYIYNTQIKTIMRSNKINDIVLTVYGLNMSCLDLTDVTYDYKSISNIAVSTRLKLLMQT